MIDMQFAKGPAKVAFEQATFTILSPGHFVPCAVTGQPIPLKELRYWSVERQEAYSSPAASLEAHQNDNQ